MAIILGAVSVTLIGAEGWLTLHLLRQNGRLLLRVDALETQLRSEGIAQPPAKESSGLRIGTQAPSFELPLLSDGSVLSLDILRGERRPIMLFFSDPDCGPCSALLPEVARWDREYASVLIIAVIGRGSPDINRLKIGPLPYSQLKISANLAWVLTRQAMADRISRQRGLVCLVKGIN